MVYRIVASQENPESRPQGLLLRDAVPRILDEHYKHTTRYKQATYLGEEIIARDPMGTVESITKTYLRTFAEDCRVKRKNSTETINIKLSFFSRMFEHFETELLGQYGTHAPGTFIKPDIPWVRKTKSERANALKWWLRPELEEKIVEWLRKNHEADFADYIEFVTHAGTRVEEALRLQRHHFDFVNNLITIPGTKTDLAHRTVPMFALAREIAQRRFNEDGNANEYLFNFSPLSTGLSMRSGSRSPRSGTTRSSSLSPSSAARRRRTAPRAPTTGPARSPSSSAGRSRVAALLRTGPVSRSRSSTSSATLPPPPTFAPCSRACSATISVSPRRCWPTTSFRVAAR